MTGDQQDIYRRLRGYLPPWFGDEANTVNALVPHLKAQGIESIVVLIHEGGAATGGINGCTGISGAIVDIVNRLDPAVDLTRCAPRACKEPRERFRRHHRARAT